MSMEKGVGAAARVFTRARFFLQLQPFVTAVPHCLYSRQFRVCPVLFQVGNIKIQTQIHLIVLMKPLNEEN